MIIINKLTNFKYELLSTIILIFMFINANFNLGIYALCFFLAINEAPFFLHKKEFSLSTKPAIFNLILVLIFLIIYHFRLLTFTQAEIESLIRYIPGFITLKSFLNYSMIYDNGKKKQMELFKEIYERIKGVGKNEY